MTHSFPSAFCSTLIASDTLCFALAIFDYLSAYIVLICTYYGWHAEVRTLAASFVLICLLRVDERDEVMTYERYDERS